MTPEQIKEQRDWLDAMAGHTESPWTFEMEEDEWPDHALVGSDGDPVLSFDFDLGFRVDGANARLIAAAPDLKETVSKLCDALDAKDSEIERLTAENQRLREALAGLELACDQLAATRTREVYLAMIDSGQQAALLFLDSHRESARAALHNTETSHDQDR